VLATALTWTVRTDVFDGPLDLLLYLVKRDGIDIRQVSMRSVCDSYLGFLERLRDLHISVASDYLVMAATLCHLKSLELLPRPPAILEDEEIDPREDLARRLETYAQYKQAAESLDARPRLGRDTFVRSPLDVGEVERPLIPGVDAFGLLEKYYAVLTRPAPAEPVHTIHKPEVDLSKCCRTVLRALGGEGGTGDLTDLLRLFQSKAERVITFVAVLEMCRLGWLKLQQSVHLAPVCVTSTVGADHSLAAFRGDLLEEAG
jgi:segregation and condensation protein A